MYMSHLQAKSDNGFPWVSAQPLFEPLLNMHTSFYMSVITYLHKLSGAIFFALALLTTGGQIPIEKHYRSFDGGQCS